MSVSQIKNSFRKVVCDHKEVINIFRSEKLYQNSSYRWCENYNLKNISLKQKDEDIQKVSRPTACLLHRPVKECDYHT